VVGHTIQRRGINSACDAKVIRIDVGLSAGCGDRSPQVLEILNDSTIHRLTETPQAERLKATANRAQQRVAELGLA